MQDPSPVYAYINVSEHSALAHLNPQQQTRAQWTQAVSLSYFFNLLCGYGIMVLFQVYENIFNQIK